VSSAADDAKMGLCEEDRILIARVQRLWSEETGERISDKMMEEDYFERFLNICKNNAQLLGSVVAEDL